MSAHGAEMPGTGPEGKNADPVTVDRLPPEIARAVLNRLLAVRPELRDLAQRLSESVIAVLEEEPPATPSMRPAPSTPEPTNGG